VEGSIIRDYEYDLLGNFDSVTKGSTLWDYSYAAGYPSRLMGVTNLAMTVNATQGYDSRGNLWKYTKSGIAYELAFDVENRLQSVKVGTGTPTTFEYDADGQRVLTTIGTGTSQVKIYTPFPDYEKEIPTSGSTTIRTTYRIAGQIVAVQTKVGPAAGTFYFTYTDHLGNVAALSWTGGTLVPGSLASYDPFGTLTTTPSTNPSITNHGFTGHRHNNTGTNDLGLIYMNARYYLPQIGRFISADTIVPDPQNPQSHNRYSYTRNNPLRFIDPTGNRECGATSGCNDYADDYPDIPIGPMVKFEASGEASWLPAEKTGPNRGARQYGQQLANTFNAAHPYWNLTAPQAFLLVYKGSITFRKVEMACSEDSRNTAETCGARTESRNLITVYEDAANITNRTQWAVHEMGHAFVHAVGSSAPIDALVTAQENPAFPNRTGFSTEDNFGFGSTHQTPLLWQQSTDDAASEEFADMILGWSYGTWAPSAAGLARQDFMAAHMATWVNMALWNY